MIALTEFGGVIPRTNAGSLPPNAAQAALNCTLWNNDLRSLKGLQQVMPHGRPGVVKTMHRLGLTLGETQHWLTWINDVDVVRGPIANDVNERTYFTGDGPPKVTDLLLATQGGGLMPQAAYRLGVPAPSEAPTLTDFANIAPAESRVYVTTFVTAWGEESKPSPYATATMQQTGSIRLAGLNPPPSGNWNITTRRIYRSSTGTSGSAALRFVGEIPAAYPEFWDTVAGSALGEVCVTDNYDMPPDGMIGLTGMENGMMAGFLGNDVYFCEPYVPYAWPAKYRHTVKEKVIGLGAFGTSLVVLTTGKPVIISGTHPSALSEETAQSGWSCVAKRSIVSTGDGVLYATPMGIGYIGSGGVKLITLPLYTEQEWAPLNPASISAYWHAGKYIAFGDFGGFILNSLEDATLTFFDGACSAGYNDEVGDKLYLAVGADIQRFANGPDLSYTWRSRKFAWTGGALPRFCRVDADGFPVTVKIYRDGVLHQSKIVQDNKAFVLKPGRPAESMEFEIAGTQRVKFFGMANDVKEFSLG